MDTINTPQNIVADLRLDYANGQTVTITVPADATFKEFYFSGDHATDRNFGAGLGKVNGLADIPAYLNKHVWRKGGRVVASKVTIYDPERYALLITCPSDALPGGLAKDTSPHIRTWGEYCASTQAFIVLPTRRETEEARKREAIRSVMFGWGQK